MVVPAAQAMVVSFDYPVVAALLVPAGMYVYRLEMADHQATVAECRWHPGVRVAAAVGMCVWPVVHQAAEVVETCVSVPALASSAGLAVCCFGPVLHRGATCA